jgi:L,D-transpeptidase YcbB
VVVRIFEAFRCFDGKARRWYDQSDAQVSRTAVLTEVKMEFGAEKRRVGSYVGGWARVLAFGVALSVLPAVALAATLPPNNIKLTTKTEVFSNKRIVPMLTAESAAQLERLAERYRNIVSEGGWPEVPNGTYKKGKKGKGVAALNLRLFTEGYVRAEATQGEFEQTFTSATEDGVRRFQRNHGLEITGKVDKSTIRALNVPAKQRLATIEANIERLRVYAQGLGDRYLVVNVPSQQIEAISGGYVRSRHNAIVGRPDRPTPVVSTALSDVIFNPYWNAPASIIERDLIPKMLKGNGVLEEMNIKVFKGFGGPEVDPEEVDWSTAIADDYHFRQEPGETNAMATAKINFPSPFGIYLHDTPDKVYFKTGDRFYSSGCVRVEQVDVLLNWILNGQDGYGQSQIAALAETQENTEVKLVEAPQLRVTYLTAFPVGETVAFYNDVYELDGTGFTVGQPMPVGELSDDGQRFVLKPVPRKPSAVDAAEADGFDLFQSSKGKRKKKSSGGLYESDSDDTETEGEPKPLANKTKKPNITASPDDSEKVAVKPAQKKPVVAETTKLKDKKLAASKQTTDGKKKEFPGLFDWGKYKKEQAALAKQPNKKPIAKRPLAKKEASKTAVASKDTTKKAEAKKVTAKKDATKKPALECKPDKAGALPKGCPPVKTADKQKKP